MKLFTLFTVFFSLLLVTDLQGQRLYTKSKKFNHPSYHKNNYKQPNKAAETSRFLKEWNNSGYEPGTETTETEFKNYYKQPVLQKAGAFKKSFQVISTGNPFVNSHFYKSQFKGKHPGKKIYVRKQENFLVLLLDKVPETDNKELIM